MRLIFIIHKLPDINYRTRWDLWAPGKEPVVNLPELVTSPRTSKKYPGSAPFHYMICFGFNPGDTLNIMGGWRKFELKRI
jgi:hypothetical protein